MWEMPSKCHFTHTFNTEEQFTRALGIAVVAFDGVDHCSHDLFLSAGEERAE